LFDRVGFEAVCATLHQQFKPKTSEPISNENTILRHHLLVLGQHAVMLTGGTLVLSEMRSVGVTKVT